VDYIQVKLRDNQERELIKFSVIELHRLIKLFRSIKMCLNDTYIRIQEGKHSSDGFVDRSI
jgi:hypothetical protein